MRNPGNVEIHRVVRSAGLYTYGRIRAGLVCRCSRGANHRIVRSGGNAVVAASLVLILAFFEPGWIGSNAFPQGTSPLRIAILEGNPVVSKDGQLRLTVEVRNDQKTPVGGAEVSFVAPDSGPGILFPDNANRLTVQTDSRGRADTGWTRSIGDGPFLVTIVASYQGQSASTSAQAENPPSTSSTTKDKKKSGKLKWILIAAAAGAVGVVLATKKSGSDTENSNPSITLGSPTVGGPQ